MLDPTPPAEPTHSQVDDRPLLRIVTAGQMKQAEDKKIADDMAMARAMQSRDRAVQGLATYVRKLWDAARNERSASNLDNRLLKCLYTRKSEYEPSKLHDIRSFGGSDVYAGITANKIRALTAWLKDVLIDQPEKPWGLDPTPIPELAPNVLEELQGIVATEIHAWMMQTGIVPRQELVDMYYRVNYDELYNRTVEEAKVRAMRMEHLIEDQFDEGNFNTEFSLFLDDYCTFPAAIFKGPVPMNRRDLKWEMDPNGQVSPKVENKVKLVYKRVSPFDIYPSPSACTPQDGYLFERHRMSSAELYNYIGVQSYSEQAIRAVLEEGYAGGLRDWLNTSIEYQRATAEDRSQLSTHDKSEVIFDVLEFWGPVHGRDLRDWGLTVEDPQGVYDVCVWLIKDWVIFAEVNPDPMGKRPYYKSSFDPIPGTFWGQSLVDILDDTQQIVNACSRATVNNMGFASGPMVGVNAERLAPGTSIDNLRPWQVFKFNNDPMGQGNNTPPLEFFQPDSNVAELQGLLEKMYGLADDLSGLPRYMQGANSSASRTASGLSMLMNAASKSVRQLVANVDRDVVSQLVQNNYTWNMLYHPDPSVKGDLCVVARGASAIIHKEAVQARRNEFLQLTANPVDQQIMGPEGRSALLREAAKGLEIDPNTIVPSLDKQRYAMASMAMQSMAGTLPQPDVGGGEVLQDGMNTPTTDNFSPAPAGPAQGGMQ